MNRKKWFQLVGLIAIAIALILTFICGATFYRFVIAYGVQNEEENLLTRAVTTAALIDASKVQALWGNKKDQKSPEYAYVRAQLKSLKNINPDLRFVYIMKLRNNEVIFLVDAEPQDSEDFSAPGDVYDEASPELFGIFMDKQPFIEGPLADAWGRWISAIAPILDPDTDEPIAVVGLDINASQWEKNILFYKVFGASIPLFMAIVVIVFSTALFKVNIVNIRLNREIFERKRAEEALRLNEARLETQLKLSQMTKVPLKKITDFALEEAIGLTGSKIGYLAFMNEDETVLSMYSWSKQAMEECGIIDKQVVYPIEETGLWGEAVRQKKPVITNYYAARNPLKKGHPKGHVPIERHMNVPVFDEDKLVAVAGVGNKQKPYDDSDVRQLTLLMQGMWLIVKRQRAEEALRESERRLARSKKMESMGLLAGGVAHDLNNVLSGIVSYPELILMDLPDDSKLKKPIETIQESGYRAAAIVQDLLTVARGVAITKEPLNLNDLVVKHLKSPECNKLKLYHPTVTIKTNLDSDLLNVKGSYVHIRKVLMNLVSNASEAIKSIGNITISTMNRFVDQPLRGYGDVTIGEYAVLAVSDDGSGIPSDDLERIFEPFYTKKVMGRSGTGLGLAVVWNAVQDHDGYIDVKSDENGTTFELYFPISREETSDKPISTPINDIKGNGETILVVDDMESQLYISCNMLEKLGYKTQSVASGEEAVEYLKKNTVDLLLLDMIMDPGINGRETYKRIIEFHPNQKAIIVSGFTESDEVKETQRLGAGKYVKKPFTIEKIGLAVKEQLEK